MKIVFYVFWGLLSINHSKSLETFYCLDRHICSLTSVFFTSAAFRRIIRNGGDFGDVWQLLFRQRLSAEQSRPFIPLYPPQRLLSDFCSLFNPVVTSVTFRCDSFGHPTMTRCGSFSCNSLRWLVLLADSVTSRSLPGHTGFMPPLFCDLKTRCNAIWVRSIRSLPAFLASHMWQ